MSLSFLCVKTLLTLCCVFIPEYILGTVHKAKGLEFDTVHVLDDFVKVPCARHNLAQLPHFRVGKGPGCTTSGPRQEWAGDASFGGLAFRWMVWRLGRILLEGKKYLLVLIFYSHTTLCLEN